MNEKHPLTQESAETKSMPSRVSKVGASAEAVPHSEKNRLTLKLFIGIITTVFGSALPSGHNLGVINTPQKVIREWLVETLLNEHNVALTTYEENILWGGAVSIFVGGALLGGFFAAAFSDRFGRKRSLFIMHLLTLISGLTIMSCQVVNKVELLLIGRLLAGLMAGASTGLIPLYLCEIAPPSWRGVMGTIFPLGLITGILLSQILGLPSLLGKADTWALLAGGHAIYAFIAVMLQPLLPSTKQVRSHLYIVSVKQDDCHVELCELPSGSSTSSEEDCQWPAIPRKQSRKELSLREVLQDRSLRLPVLVISVLNAGQQLTGINAVFFYSTLVFMKAGLTMSQSQAASLTAGVANLLMGASAVPIVRYCKRKTLLYISVTFYLVWQIVLTISLYLLPTQSWAPWLAFVSLFATVITYGIGLGPVPYMIGTEMFPDNARKVGLSLGSMSNWGSNLLVGLLFPVINEYLGILSFGMFAIVCGLLLAFIYTFVPETLNKNNPSS